MKKGINRRNFFKIAAAGGATAVAVGCGSDPIEKLIPMMVPPADYVPSVSIHFATTCQECSANCGVIIRTREGRAIKAEGNTDHPNSGNGLCAIGQSSLQALYSPSRAKSATKGKGKDKSTLAWKEGISELSQALTSAKGKVLLLGTPRTGTLASLRQKLISKLKNAELIQYDITPVNSLKKANEISFGKAEIPHYNLGEAKVVLNFGADFLESWLYPAKLTTDYAEMHAYKHGEKGKFYHISPHMSLTGTNADEWVTCPAGTEAQVALAITHSILGRSAETGPYANYLKGFSAPEVAKRTGVSADKIKQLAQDFNQPGKTLALAGGTSNAGKEATQLHIAVNLLNQVVGNIGTTVQFGADYKIGGDGQDKITQAIEEMKAGKVELVLIDNVNPVYSLPESSGFAEALQKVAKVISLNTENDETSALASLHLPASHYYESWGDSRPRNGIYGLSQPVMSKIPMCQTKEIGDILLEVGKRIGVAGVETKNFQEYLKTAWLKVKKEVGAVGTFQSFWEQTLQKGGVYQDFKTTSVTFSKKALLEKVNPKVNPKGLNLLPVNSTQFNATGISSNRSWMLETPHPITQIVWDSWVEINPDTAIKLGIRHGDLVEVTGPKGKVELAAWLYYGIEENTVAIPAGMGRNVPFPTYKSSYGKSVITPVIETKADLRVEAFPVGVKVVSLLPFERDRLSGDFAFASSQVTIKPTGKKSHLVTMDGMAKDDIYALNADSKAGMGDRSQKDRGLVLTTTPEVLSGHAAEGEGEPKEHHLRRRKYTMDRKDNVDFYDPREEDVANSVRLSGKDGPKYYDPYKFETTIDLDRCTGCSACVVACFAENNIPMVGKDRNRYGREMSWLRIERYIEKNEETGQYETYFTPEMCNQCVNAGCEPVCPVYATYHNPEGINAMIYNRCVGTRYCANNCIYKQRKFNWRSYEFPSPLHLQLNPAMTVREKGVMEKCNFCYARIREMKDLAKDEGRIVADGEIQTACQQTCGTNAITFGNAMDPKSKLSKIKSSSKRTYIQFGEVNYKPSVTYLKKVNHNNRKA